MPSTEKPVTIREAVGYFSNADTLQEAIDELLESGFNRANLSLLASEQAFDEKLGQKYQKITKFEDDTSTPRTGYIAPESIGDAEGVLIGTPLYIGAVAATGAIIASGGTLVAAMAGAALAGGAGALIGSVLAKFVGDRHADNVQAQLEQGGLLLWVRTWDAADESRATAILSKHSGHDVHVHTILADV